MRSRIARAACILSIFNLATTGFAELSTPARQSPGCNSTEARDAGVYAFGEIERLVRDWNLHLRNISKTASVAGQLDAFRRKVGIPLSFSAGPGSVELPKELPRLENREGLCGTDISVFTKSLDASAISGKGILKGDLVLEIDPDGKVLRQWTTEYNWVSVEAVRGDEILSPYRASQLCVWESDATRVTYDVWLAIRPNGTFSVVDPRPNSPAPKRRECRGDRHFGDSEYVGCWEYKDLDTGEVRILMYNAPCT